MLLYPYVYCFLGALPNSKPHAATPPRPRPDALTPTAASRPRPVVRPSPRRDAPRLASPAAPPGPGLRLPPLLTILLPILGLGAFLFFAGQEILQSNCPNCGKSFQILNLGRSESALKSFASPCCA